MRTYIEKRKDDRIVDWRVIIDENDATTEAIAEKVRELTWNGVSAGTTISVFESDMTSDELRYDY